MNTPLPGSRLPMACRKSQVFDYGSRAQSLRQINGCRKSRVKHWSSVTLSFLFLLVVFPRKTLETTSRDRSNRSRQNSRARGYYTIPPPCCQHPHPQEACIHAAGGGCALLHHCPTNSQCRHPSSFCQPWWHTSPNGLYKLEPCERHTAAMLANSSLTKASRSASTLTATCLQTAA